jgi:hypothetical protein
MFHACASDTQGLSADIIVNTTAEEATVQGAGYPSVPDCPRGEN